MSDEAKKILKEMVKEYELLAKYNGGKDYIYWKTLLEVCKELDAKTN